MKGFRTWSGQVRFVKQTSLTHVLCTIRHISPILLLLLLAWDNISLLGEGPLDFQISVSTAIFGQSSKKACKTSRHLPYYRELPSMRPDSDRWSACRLRNWRDHKTQSRLLRFASKWWNAAFCNLRFSFGSRSAYKQHYTQTMLNKVCK